MFRIYWSNIVAFGGVAIALAILATALITHPRASDPKYKTDSNQNAAQAEHVISDCERGAIPSCRFYETDPAVSGGGRATDHQGDITALPDLYAQDRMAHWTAYIGVFSAFGIVLLAGTLWESARAAKAANAAATATAKTNQIMQDEKRPWLSLEREVSCEFELIAENTKASCVWNYKIVNKGRSPAHRVRIAQRVVRYRNLTGLFALFGEFVEAAKQSSETAAVTAIFPDEEWPKGGPEEVRPARAPSLRLDTVGDQYALMVCVTYQRTRDGEIGVDGQLFGIEPVSFDLVGPERQLKAYGWARIIE